MVPLIREYLSQLIHRGPLLNNRLQLLSVFLNDKDALGISFIVPFLSCCSYVESSQLSLVGEARDSK